LVRSSIGNLSRAAFASAVQIEAAIKTGFASLRVASRRVAAAEFNKIGKTPRQMEANEIN